MERLCLLLPMKDLISMISASKLTNLARRITITSLSFSVYQMREDLVLTLPIWIKVEFGHKTRKETISLFMQMVTPLRNCQFHLIWIRWSKELKIRSLIHQELEMVNTLRMNVNFCHHQSQWHIQGCFISKMMGLA